MKDLRTRIDDLQKYYPEICVGAKPPSASEDKLGVQRLEQTSAPWEDTAFFKARIEQVLGVLNEDVAIYLHYYLFQKGRDLEAVIRFWPSLTSRGAAYRAIERGRDRIVAGYFGKAYRKRRRRVKRESKLDATLAEAASTGA